MTDNQFSEVLNYCRKNFCTPDGNRVCFLCGHVPQPSEDAAVGVFIPHAEHRSRFGAPPNKTRLMIYVLCGDCNTHLDRNERVEDKILSEATAQ